MKGKRGLVIAAFVVVAWSAALAQDGVRKAGTYKDASRGFSMNPPAFKPGADPGIGTVAIFFAPPEDGFTANVNLVLQKAAFDDFLKTSDAGFKTVGFEVLSKKLSTTAANRSCEYVYKGSIQGKPMKFMALAVDGGDRVFLLTGTSLESNYDKYEATFKASISSFALDK